MTTVALLTQGKTVVVDDDDKDLLSLKWCTAKMKKMFYAQRHVYNKDGVRTSELLHRVVASRMGLEGEIDHKDRNGLNCTRANLRTATASQNGANKGLQSNNKSGVKGVSWNKRDRKWQANISINGKKYHVGYFNDLKLAEAAIKAVRESVFGEFSCHG